MQTLLIILAITAVLITGIELVSRMRQEGRRRIIHDRLSRIGR
jgi:hypothetical protein